MRDVFRKSFSAGFPTMRVSVSDGEAQLTQASGSSLPSISDNGDLVAFTNFGTGVAPDDGADDERDRVPALDHRRRRPRW